MTDNLKRVVFDFGDASDCEDDSHSANMHNDERISSQHSSNMRICDVADFKRIEVKRNSRKNRTEIPTKKLFTIEKLTEEITKITEDLELETHVSFESQQELKEPEVESEDQRRKSTRQRTIRFHNKKTRFQYPKELDNKADTEPDSDSKPSEAEEDCKEKNEQEHI